MFKYEFHPLASSLPLMREPDFTEFCQDIKKNGQLLPIGIFEGKILDGRNRYNACKKLRIEGKFEKIIPRDAKAYVTSLNVHRRQLTREERQHHLMLLIAKQDALQMTNEEVATAANVSKRTVQRKKRETSKKVTKRPFCHPSSNGEILDSARYSVPAMAYWNRKSEVQEILTHISKAKSIIGKIADGDPLYRRISNVQRTWKELDSLYNEYKGVLPSYVCPICDGVKVDGCKPCVGTGVISEYVWGLLTPEQRAKRGMEIPF